MAGVADAGIRGYLGAKQFFGGLDPEEQAVLRMQEEEAKADPEFWKRTGGNVLGNAALTVIPASKAAKAAKILPKWLTLGGVGTAAGVSGAQGLVLNPGQGETVGEQLTDKAKAAGVDAALGGALGAVGKGVVKAGTGMFQATKEAIDLMREGVTPTLQQGAESSVGRFIGGLASGFKDVKTRQGKEVIDAYLRRVAPNIDLTDMNVPEKINLLRSHFLGDQASGVPGEFGKVLGGKKYSLGPTERSAVWAAARGARGTQPEATQMAMRAMSGTGTALQGKNRVTMGADKLTEYRNLIQDQIDAFGRDPSVMSSQAKKNLIAAKDTFDKLVRDPSLSPDELAQLKEINTRYGDFLRFEGASKTEGFRTEPNVRGLARELSKADPYGFAGATNQIDRELLEPAARVVGTAESQSDARMLKQTLTRIAKGVGAAGAGTAATMGGAPALTLMGAGYGLSALGQTKPGAKFLFGQYEQQKALADAARRIAPFLSGSGQIFSGE
jgi:hypothetical protein